MGIYEEIIKYKQNNYTVELNMNEVLFDSLKNLFYLNFSALHHQKHLVVLT